MKDIAIFGAGGFGREVACLIRIINESLDDKTIKKHHLMPDEPWNFIGFFDDNPSLKEQQISHFGKCLGGVDDLNKWDKPLAVCIAIGNPRIVGKIIKSITNSNISYPNLVHPDFSMSDPQGFNIGRGNIIQGGCGITTDVTLGDFNVLNGSVVLAHDDIVGDYNSFMPATRISGEVKIGNRNFFGVSSIVLQQITIKNDTKVAAGSVLMTKPKEGGLYIGVPAKLMKL